jgi:Trypsin-like peptidase domain/von Willebrand factor type A domain
MHRRTIDHAERASRLLMRGEGDLMSHITGTIQVLGTPLTIGTGTTLFNPPAAPGGTKFLLLHFGNLHFNPGDQLQVSLGYDVDTFTAADGPEFWTRPIDVYAFPAGVPVTYIPAGPPTGNVQLDRYGRGERHAGESGHPSYSNCDPFYQAPAYLEPTYDPFWYCANPPNWENVACIPSPADVRARVARSVGMIVSVENSDFTGILQISTCSVTLVDADKVLTAGHCHKPEEAVHSSVTFDYQTGCDGTRPGGYSPRFYKVKAVLGHKNIDQSLDYSLLQLAEAPVGVPPIQMRHDFPLVGEQVFGVHHPNGAVKKLSIPNGQGFSTVQASGQGGVTVPHDFHVSGGSSGSGLFDAAGRIVGVLSRGAPCSPGGALAYCPTKNILADLVPAPPPPITRDVVVVFDRSGSMSMDDGTGRAKIDVARDAVSLFVQLVRTGTGNRLGLVSFSTAASSPVDSGITGVTMGAKATLIGLAPYSAGIVGGLVPGGMTSIGGGLDAARAQFPMPGANPRAILLLTDGLQNTAPMVGDVELALAGITVHAIGFGTESSLDGDLLNTLAGAHGGMYTRAGNGLALEKFFSGAFGNIFEAGILMDPEFDLAANQRSGKALPFRVCGEETITAVAGWDRSDASLSLEVISPSGATVTGAIAGVDSASGRTWTFLRIPLPLGSERNGTWTVNVVRPRSSGEFPPPTPALRYFLSVIPSGGPRMTRLPDARRYYTGDAINPMVIVRQANGGWPDGMEIGMTITRPNASVGTILGHAGLGLPGTSGADVIPARQATLQAIESATGHPVVGYVETHLDLTDAAVDTGGLFEGGGTFGKEMNDLLTVEGNYTFHAKATYGDDCAGMRELMWSIHVDVGIDPGKTSVSSTPAGSGPDGGPCVSMTFTPRDKYGNLLGPGRGDSFTVEAQPGSVPSGPVKDLGNGAYQVHVCSDPDSLEPPRIAVAQPGRPPTVLESPEFKLFVYSVKFLCGEQRADECCGRCAPVRPGRYATEINIHNPSAKEAPVLKRVIPLVAAGVATGREPNSTGPATRDLVRLPAHAATMDDCCRILEMLHGKAPTGSPPLTLGILEVISTVEISVTAVYTVSGDGGGAPSIDVRQIEPRALAR